MISGKMPGFCRCSSWKLFQDSLVCCSFSYVRSVDSVGWKVAVFRRKDILSFICILLFVGLKMTYVFFSWLNYFLLASGLDLAGISGLVFVVGFLMFMLPIVPGTAVYLFSGVVPGIRSRTKWPNASHLRHFIKSTEITWNNQYWQYWYNNYMCWSFPA